MVCKKEAMVGEECLCNPNFLTSVIMQSVGFKNVLFVGFFPSVIFYNLLDGVEWSGVEGFKDDQNAGQATRCPKGRPQGARF